MNSLFNQSIGTVGTQTNLSNFGWGNGVPRWKQWLETNADFSFYSYDSAGSTPRKTLSIVNTTGVCTAPDFQSLSDVSLKSNIKPLDRGL
ncbi:hypothetical protein [Dyella sp. SG609]|uniref:hypothetical protein n=1 Tax=Dyella sp. SG609 TaxID=2587018 RepID=UPI0014489BEC|nr:hypothetical protein [Dyella sp. SG609]NKJ22031.1 hypothetical protein [Dyella sp. SG609]